MSKAVFGFDQLRKYIPACIRFEHNNVMFFSLLFFFFFVFRSNDFKSSKYIIKKLSNNKILLVLILSMGLYRVYYYGEILFLFQFRISIVCNVYYYIDFIYYY
jgi:hypothetical protein